MAVDNYARLLASKALQNDIDNFIVNSESTATDKAYSANYTNNIFVKNSILSNLWWTKTGASTANLTNTQPTVSSSNTMVTTSTNTTFNFNAPTGVLTRQVSQDTSINPNMIMTVDMRVLFSRAGNVEYGAKVLGTDGTTVIASPQSFGSVSIDGTNINRISFNIIFNNITEPYRLTEGQTITIQLFKRQNNTASLTSTYYAGVNLNGVDYYCWNQWQISTPTSYNTISVDTSASPSIILLNDYTHRCTNATLTIAPAITLSAIASILTPFESTVTYKSPNTTPPVVTNNSGYLLFYRGLDVSGSAFVPVNGTVYKMNFVFNGINIICYIS